MTKKKPKITRPFVDVLPLLRPDELAALRDRINGEGGVHDAVILSTDNEVLDGHNRLSIQPNAPRYVLKDSKDWSEGEKRAYVFRCNTARRNLSDEEIKEYGLPIARMLNKQKFSDKKIAELLGVTQPTISNWLCRKSINGIKVNIVNSLALKIPGELHEPIADRVNAGETTVSIARELKVTQGRISQIVNRINKKREKEEARRAGRKSSTSDNDVRLGDFREVSKSIADNSIDLIFTDPPYDRESLPLYGDLAVVAARLLVDGGSLLTYAGHVLIGEVIQLFQQQDFRFYWCCAIVHTGRQSRMSRSGIVVGWKPLLWFVKGGERFSTGAMVEDTVISQQEKDDHPWQQSVIEARHFIEILCPVNGIVFDPFAGSGTSLLAAKQSGRRWLGCEIKAEYVEAARQRLDDENI